MGQEPDAIRQEIEDTRERMGGTVDALAYKADVKSRTKEKVTDKVDSLKEKVTGATGTVSDAAPSGDDVKQGAQRAVGVAQENPLGLAIGAVAVGFVAGMLIPGTRVENDKFGHVADQVKEQVKSTAEDAVEHGKQVAQDAAHSAVETAKESGEQHAQDLQETARDNAQAVSPGTTGA
jgi:gas vesicle protein